ncbi:MAG: hypothetical protein LBV31_03945 [Prevotellaceae bacterium]|jgi:hypothetical protein|nr:hypothetical protein [Prevotellaceae bacterium]
MRRIFIRLHIVVLLLMSTFSVLAQQDDVPVTVRTPEQEALRQTERMKTDFGLTATQEKLVYNINLKYERERQLYPNDRRKALERYKNKTAELKKVLTEKQYQQLQRKRYDPTIIRREQEKTSTEIPE